MGLVWPSETFPDGFISQFGHYMPEFPQTALHRPLIGAYQVKNNTYNAVNWHQKPDYVDLLIKRFDDDKDDEEELSKEIIAHRSDADKNSGGLFSTVQKVQNNKKIDERVDENNSGSELDESYEKLLESKARGRHQLQAPGLCISRIEKLLAKRKDLTQQQRRRLQSRKNTANFRERQKNTFKLKAFLNFELDLIINQVSHLFRNVTHLTIFIIFLVTSRRCAHLPKSCN